MSGESAQIEIDELDRLKTELSDNAAKLLSSEKEILKLTKLCADLMNKDLQAVEEADSWSLGSGGAEADAELLKEKLKKCKQNEELLKMQLEAMQSTVKIMIHPDDIESREKKLKAEISELSIQVEQLLAANMSMKLDICQVEESRAEAKQLQETGETKTRLIEELHEKLAKYEEQNTALFESLSEAEKSEQALRESLTR
ncbi:uncharacterized protein [Watersipora subatra]|uniref:uncharacterized protein n=1 Tax=Watersipora subatra TaxID=2589382 RepID=UPI00355B423E